MIDWSVGRNSLSRRHRAGVSGNITSGFAARICQRFLHDRDEPPEPLQRQAGALGSMMRANQNTIAGNGHPLDRTGMKAGMQAGFYRALRRMACGRTVSTSRFTTFFSRTMKRFNPSLIALAVAAALAGCSQLPQAAHTSRATAGVKEMAEAPLIIGTYNPGEEAIFAVSSTLVQGKKEAVLIDAQFSAADARKVAEMVRKSGKKLTTIYISHSDPDYYFGLDTLHAAFPEARIVATPQTIRNIRATEAVKRKVWGPQLGENAPKQIIIPEPLDGDRLKLEGQTLQVVGLDGPSPDRTFVWIPSIRVVAGGIPVVAGEHVWMADTQTPASHAAWLETLARIEQLQPSVVIPGHYAPGSALDTSAARFTADYIRAFDEETAKARNSAELIEAMKVRYPKLSGEGSLEMSTKVAKGEMQWP